MKSFASGFRACGIDAALDDGTVRAAPKHVLNDAMTDAERGGAWPLHVPDEGVRYTLSINDACYPLRIRRMPVDGWYELHTPESLDAALCAGLEPGDTLLLGVTARWREDAPPLVVMRATLAFPEAIPRMGTSPVITAFLEGNAKVIAFVHVGFKGCVTQFAMQAKLDGSPYEQ